ncbi:coiled-coil domain-containing protein 170-like isoform X2 [Saccoglossus kowalevskii]|uniref:Coiled-coil domain-containing protein 170-like isoform X1 n=1 Tax=Saccoglossus kowalevskii TaxID=10224 RepID=A0ABM0GVD2_SACKO|nr:PREDICTED: coiled-coil domain-containing protein 170-like isoform X1 [Saccoglossus kowalevskii]
MSSYFRDGHLDGLPRLPPRHGLVDSHYRGSKLTRFDESSFHDSSADRWIHNRSAPSSLHLRSASPVLGGPHTPAPPPTAHRMVQELHDQVSFLRSELEKKDRLVSELTRAPESPRLRRRSVDDSNIEALYSAELSRSRSPSQQRFVAESTRSEFTALQVKHDRLMSEIRDVESKLTAKELQLQDMRLEIGTYKENESRQAALIESLRERLRIIENETGSLETTHTRGEITIAALQRENRQHQDRILEMESRIRSMTIEKEESVQKALDAERRFSELSLEMSRALAIDGSSQLTGGFERISSRVNELVQENLLLRGRLNTLTEHLNSAELESKASRETIMRLVSEISREQKSVSSTVSTVENMRVERDSAMMRKNELEREVQLLKERMEANRRAWESTRMELEHRDTRVSALDHDLKTHQYNAQVAEASLRSLKESLAALLGDSFMSYDEESIKEKVRQLHLSVREKDARVELLENKLKTLTDQLESQVNLHQCAIRRAKEAEFELDSHRGRMHSLEGELATREVLRDGLLSDKEKKMASILKVDQMASDVGFDMYEDALMSRTSQLVRMESDAVANKTTAVYTLQRKVKNLREQLDSKDLHLDLLRKKISNLEEGLHGRSGLQKDRDDLEFSYKKLRKENERLRGLLGTARETIKDLKVELLNSSNLKIQTLDQQEKIEQLLSSIDHLERTKEKQSRKLTGIKQELEFTEHEVTEERTRVETALVQVENELRATKRLLEETARRERQLVDFRQVMARMLGLDVGTLAVPDYEIIARLEKLIQAHHSHSFTTHTLEHSLTDMERGLKDGFSDARGILGTSPRRSRARSLSPSRRRHIHTTKY